jgi:AraC-like DNA-binding protein
MNSVKRDGYLMKVEKVIHLHYGANWVGYQPVSHTPYHLLMFVEQGSCTYWIDGNKYVVEKGEVLFIAEGLVRAAEKSIEAHSKLSIHWTGDGLFGHFPHLEKQVMLFKSAPLYTYLKQSYYQMHHIWAKKDKYYRTLCEAMLLEITVRIHQEDALQRSSGKQVRMVQQVRDYILEYYREPLSIEELAQQAERNASHLITSFKKHYGMAPLEYMHRTRITKAEELLLSTNINIEEIAIELGYCDAAYFNRMFKKLTGMTPSAYRRQL